MIRIITQAILLILIQALIFDKLIIGGCAMAHIFLYTIIAMPVTLNDNIRLTIAFLSGLAIDILTNTQGLNALCCTLTIAIQRPIFHLYVNREEDLGGASPSSQSMGLPAFIKYALSIALIYTILYHSIETFSLHNYSRMLLRIATGTIYTLTIIIATDTILTHRRRAKN